MKNTVEYYQGLGAGLEALFGQRAPRDLKAVAIDLDDLKGSVNMAKITLNDISELVAKLRIDMDEASEENIRIAFLDFHRQIRVLDGLTRLTVEEFSKDAKQLSALSGEIYEAAFEEKKKPNPIAPEKAHIHHQQFYQE